MFRFFRFLVLALALCPMAAVATNLVNINTASVSTLQRVKGINSTRANAIVEYRRTHGHFRSVNDLTRVRGINERTLNKIRPHVTVGNVHKNKHPQHPQQQHPYQQYR